MLQLLVNITTLYLEGLNYIIRYKASLILQSSIIQIILVVLSPIQQLIYSCSKYIIFIIVPIQLSILLLLQQTTVYLSRLLYILTYYLLQSLITFSLVLAITIAGGYYYRYTIKGIFYSILSIRSQLFRGLKIFQITLLYLFNRLSYHYYFNFFSFIGYLTTLSQ